jgi:hypothetical protein
MLRAPMRSSIILCATLVAACGGGGGSASTPEGVVRASVDALNHGDAHALNPANASPQRLQKALTCARRPSIVDQVGTRVSVLAKRPDTIAGLHVELRAITDVTTRQVAKGEAFHECTSNEAFEVASYRLEETVTQAGDAHFAGQEGEAIRLDGRWYLL